MCANQLEDLRSEEGHGGGLTWEKNRVFFRGLESSQYGISEYRDWVRQHPRVRRWDDVKWDGGPGVFHKMAVITPATMPVQTVYMHMLELAPGALGYTHGHQNDALMYILEGRGYDIHDGKRYDWKAGDALIIHNNSIHQHCNSDPDLPARALIIKSKPLILFLNLVEQRKISPEVLTSDKPHQPRPEFSRAGTAPGEDQ